MATSMGGLNQKPNDGGMRQTFQAPGMDPVLRSFIEVKDDPKQVRVLFRLQNIPIVDCVHEWVAGQSSRWFFAEEDEHEGRQNKTSHA